MLPVTVITVKLLSLQEKSAASSSASTGGRAHSESAPVQHGDADLDEIVGMTQQNTADKVSRVR